MFKIISAEKARSMRDKKIDEKEINAILRRIDKKIRKASKIGISMNFMFCPSEEKYKSDVMFILTSNGYKTFVISDREISINWKE